MDEYYKKYINICKFNITHVIVAIETIINKYIFSFYYSKIENNYITLSYVVVLNVKYRPWNRFFIETWKF